MYGTSPYFSQQAYQQDLINMRDRLDKQIQQAQMTPQHQPTAINQTFQLSPTQNSSGIKFAKDIDEVKKELVFTDTLFVNKEYTLLWYKNALGEVKTYELKEIIELDEKDRRIAELEAKLEALEKETNNERTANNSNANEPVTNKKS